MTLEEVREKIDVIDKELLRLLNERAECVNIVGEIKHKAGLEIYAPEREERLLRKLVALNAAQQGRLPERSIRAIYREIMSAALALEQALSIVYLGPPGSQAHQAALQKFGHGVGYIAEIGAAALFRRVEQTDASYGVLPFEHSAQGSVHHALDQFVSSPLQICAQMLVAGDGGARSRYLILGRRASQPTGDDLTMLVVEMPDRVGALRQVLETIERHGVNVQQIENRPAAPDSHSARIFLEVTGHAEEASLAAAIEEMRSSGSTVKVLGSYPASAWVEPGN